MARRSSGVRQQAAAALAWLERAGQHLLCHDDPRYPALLAELDDAPPLLFVAGAPELLERPQLRQLRQRITFSYRLRPLDLADTRRYVEERLQHAGHRGLPLFDGRALRRLAAGSGGIPRLINILAHKALMAAFGAGSRRVGVRHVQRALADSEETRAARRPSPAALRWGVAGAALLLALLGLWAWRHGWPGGVR